MTSNSCAAPELSEADTGLRATKEVLAKHPWPRLRLKYQAEFCSVSTPAMPSPSGSTQPIGETVDALREIFGLRVLEIRRGSGLSSSRGLRV